MYSILSLKNPRSNNVNIMRMGIPMRNYSFLYFGMSRVCLQIHIVMVVSNHNVIRHLSLFLLRCSLCKIAQNPL